MSSEHIRTGAEDFARSIGIMGSSDRSFNDDDIKSAVANVAFAGSEDVDPAIASPEVWRAMLLADPEGTKAASEFAYRWDFDTTPRQRALMALREAILREASGTFDALYAGLGADAAKGATGRAAALHARRTGLSANGGMK